MQTRSRPAGTCQAATFQQLWGPSSKLQSLIAAKMHSSHAQRSAGVCSSTETINPIVIGNKAAWGRVRLALFDNHYAWPQSSRKRGRHLQTSMPNGNDGSRTEADATCLLTKVRYYHLSGRGCPDLVINSIQNHAQPRWTLFLANACCTTLTEQPQGMILQNASWNCHPKGVALHCSQTNLVNLSVSTAGA